MRRNRGTTVHPHACGVYSSSSLGGSESGGPSPRMWGLPRRSSRAPERRPVHPHACGVYVTSWLAPSSAFGPSPRMWGLLLGILGRPVPARSIPTHVGFTRCGSLCCRSLSVHPHACGVYQGPRWNGQPYIGPSPRMWGLRKQKSSSQASHSVHPHACGVYDASNPRWSCCSGPSPRMWGLLRRATW